MEKLIAALTATVLMTSAAALAAEKPSAPVIAIKGLAPQACVAGAVGDVCDHVFGGRTITVTVKDEKTGDDQKPERIKATTAAPVLPPGHPAPSPPPDYCVQTDAQLVQFSARLQAPVPDAADIAHGPCGDITFEVKIPAVEHETEFHVVVTRPDENGKPAEAGELSLMAYPENLLDPVKSWAAYKDNALIVKDPDGRLLDLFDRNRVEYQLHEMAPAEAKKLHIIVGDPPERGALASGAEDMAGDVIYLREKTDPLPVVRIHETAKRTRIDVKTKLLDALAADDPLAEKEFVEIFNEIAK
ncbi:MAG: hypothetical protein GC185_13050 [Alphaproteobacteria bacterium]|nr:hypothetical protein [Alphaproteobacteria bacterium]